MIKRAILRLVPFTPMNAPALSPAPRRLGLASLCLGAALLARAADPAATLTLDATKPGPVINKAIYGQFAEHLGRCIYEGLWVGPDSPMANLRRTNGREKPWKVPYLAIGNESWGCGGNMTPEFYADNYKRYNTFAAPDVVKPAPFAGAKLVGTQLTVTLPAKSVVVLALE